MSDNEQAAHCPYCGAEMKYHFDYPSVFCDVQFICPQCFAMSPRVRCRCNSTENVENAEKEAAIAAMKRYEEPNRILTLDEIRSHDDYIWCEQKFNGFSYAGYVENRKLYTETDEIELDDIDVAKWYKVYGRCWLRKPTKLEVENTPWEDEKNVR